MRRSELIYEVETLLLHGKPGRRHDPLPEPETVRFVIENLALKLLTEGGVTYTEEHFAESLLADEKAILLKKHWSTGPVDTRKFLYEVATRSSLILPRGRHKNQWRFLHRSIQEHMAARCLVRRGPNEWESLAKSLKTKQEEDTGHLGQWAETFAFLAGEVDNPNKLLKKLMEINNDLGLRALATAEQVDQDTFHELLDMAPGGDNWEKRSEVIKSIPDLLKHSVDAVNLLMRIQKNTTHGADLFFLSESYKQISKQTDDPSVAKFAKSCNENIFGELHNEPHIDFMNMVTIKGEKIDLWRDIPEGEFLMGSPKTEEGRLDWELTPIPISLSAFQLAAVPITNGMYEQFDPSHKDEREFKEEINDIDQVYHPVVNITWYEAVMFCRWLTKTLHKHGRIKPSEKVHLPSDAQWEYACRATSQTRFWSGNKVQDLDKTGWYGKNSNGRTHRVGKKLCNNWNLYDIHGNVWEWCQDIEGEHHSGNGHNPLTDVNNSSSQRVVRGGSWVNNPQDCRSSFRVAVSIGYHDISLGFRPAISYHKSL